MHRENTIRKQKLHLCSVSAEPEIWYVGKTQCIRTQNKKDWTGQAYRFKEHSKAMWINRGGQVDRPRYKFLGSCSSWAVSMVPIAFGDEKRTHWYEISPIKTIQPPTQRGHGPSQHGASVHNRPPKWQRAKPGLTIECKLNLINNFKQKPMCMQKLVEIEPDFEEVCQSKDHNTGLTKKQVTERLYHRGWESILVTFLADKGTRLDYTKTWRHALFVEYSICIWHLCSRLSQEGCAVAKEQ